MSLGQGNSIATPKLHQLSVTQSVAGIVVKILYGQNRVQQDLIWSGDLTAGKPYQQGGKGLGKGGQGYEYFAAVLGVLCQGPIAGVANIWGQTGRLTLSKASEPYTVPSGGGTYTVSQAATYASDYGVGRTDNYSVTANDYGSPGPVVMAGTQTKSMSPVDATPGSAQYVQDGGNYSFSAADAGKTVTINYVFSLYTLSETEDYNVPSTGYQITVQYQSQFVADEGVIYIASGVPMTRVSGTPAVGQYNPNGGNYQFAAADATQAVAISYSWKQSESNVDPSSTLSFEIIEGDQGQDPWSYLTSKHPSQALGYSTLALTATPKMDLGQSAQMPNYNYEVMGQFQFGAGIVDAEVAFCIQDLLTNPIYGAKFAGMIDASLMGAARSYWNSNSFFISPLLDTSASCASVIEGWLEAGNTAWFWSEGKLKFVPYGDTTTVGNGYTYTPQTHPVFDFDEDDFLGDMSSDPVSIERKNWEDNYNAVKIQFTNRINNYNPDIVQEFDDFAISEFGLNQEGQKDYSFICTQTAATFAANLRLKRLVYVNGTYHFEVSAVRYGALEPMDLVTLTDEDLGLYKTPVRVTEISEDADMVMQVTAEEFPWGTASATLYPKQGAAPNQPVGTQTSSGNAVPYVFETTPQQLNGGQNAISIAATGGKNWGGCRVWVSGDNASYDPVGVIDASNRIGVLTALLPTATDPDTTHTLSVDMTVSKAALQSGTVSDADNFATLCAITNADGSVELISFETATLTSAFNYNLTYLRRGVYGSKIAGHAPGAQFSRLDNGLFQYQYPAQYVGKTIFLKFTSFNLFGQNEQQLSDVTAQSFTVPGTTLGTPAKGAFVAYPTNPLTAQALSSTAQISCSPFTASYNGASVQVSAAAPVTGLNQNQLYFVYYIDLAFRGGPVTLHATQVQSDFLGKSGYYQIGSIITPGTGATSYRPSSYSDTGTNTTTNPSYAYDLNPSSYADVQAISSKPSSSAASTYPGQISYRAFPSVVAGSTLSVSASADLELVGSGSNSGTIQVSFDNGSTFTTIHTFATTTATASYTIAVPGGTNLSSVVVKINTTAVASSTGAQASTDIYVYDISIA